MANDEIESSCIGELLVSAGIVSASDYSEVEKLSVHTKIHFGRLLIMSGCLAEAVLDCALEAARMVETGVVPKDVAVDALRSAVEKELSFTRALEILNILPQFGSATNDLAQIISEAQIIEDKIIEQATELSLTSNTPLSRVLLNKKCIPTSLLDLLNKMQDEIRNKTVNKEQAIKTIRDTYAIWKKADDAHNGDPLSKSPIRSLENVELTQQSINPTQLLNEQSSDLGEPCDYDEYANAAQSCTPEDNTDTTYSTELEGFDLIDLFVHAGFFTEDELLHTVKQALNDANTAPEILRLIANMEKSIIDAGIRAHKLVKSGSVSTEQAIISLSEIRERKNKQSQHGKTTGKNSSNARTSHS